jgi:phosphopantothenoylcysteine decarboxylase/phosphopantothenate--cysteine ligase
VKPGKRKSQSAVSLIGKRIVVTAGPCREPIDPVRFISNRSSGKMGYALAEAAASAGATTTLVSGPVCLTPPSGVEFVSIETTEQLFSAVSRRFDSCDCLIMAAAPADYRVTEVASKKIKKDQAALQLNLVPAVDILRTLAPKKKPGQLLIGFALETHDGLANAHKKLAEKNLDLIVLNNPLEDGAGFDHDTNRVTIIRPKGDPEEWPLLSKAEISLRILDIVQSLL